jgi:formiminotetrahydrofolate cyclodeaminase
MRTQQIGQFLEQLAARVPAPGGGATAALHAAQSAALLGMVARYSDGHRYVADEPMISKVRRQADAARGEALALAEADATAFAAVAAAYQLPSRDPVDQVARAEAIAAAVAAAAEPPAAVVALAGRLVVLAEELLPVGNPNLLPDVAAAAEAARAAATTARVSVEINLVGVADDAARVRLATGVAVVDVFAARAERVTAAVRSRIAG